MFMGHVSADSTGSSPVNGVGFFHDVDLSFVRIDRLGRMHSRGYLEFVVLLRVQVNRKLFRQRLRKCCEEQEEMASPTGIETIEEPALFPRTLEESRRMTRERARRI